VAGCRRNAWPGHRNRWPGAVGTPGRVRSERVAGCRRNTQPPQAARRSGNSREESVVRLMASEGIAVLIRKRRAQEPATCPVSTHSPSASRSRRACPVWCPRSPSRPGLRAWFTRRSSRGLRLVSHPQGSAPPSSGATGSSASIAGPVLVGRTGLLRARLAEGPRAEEGLDEIVRTEGTNGGVPEDERADRERERR